MEIINYTMSIQVVWDNPQQNVICITLARGWTWDNLQGAIQQADDLIISVPQVVHLLIDIREAGGMPRDWMTRAGDLFAQGEARPNEGQKIVVGAGMLIRAAYQGFLAVYGRNLQGRPFQFAASVEEARTLIDL
jgi:hypothetical protein